MVGNTLILVGIFLSLSGCETQSSFKKMEEVSDPATTAPEQRAAEGSMVQVGPAPVRVEHRSCPPGFRKADQPGPGIEVGVSYSSPKGKKQLNVNHGCMRDTSE